MWIVSSLYFCISILINIKTSICTTSCIKAFISTINDIRALVEISRRIKKNKTYKRITKGNLV